MRIYDKIQHALGPYPDVPKPIFDLSGPPELLIGKLYVYVNAQFDRVKYLQTVLKDASDYIDELIFNKNELKEKLSYECKKNNKLEARVAELEVALAAEKAKKKPELVPV